ncbi:MAG: M14 family zinc carboxypeptidase, partial [Gemmatimonadota bacterium]
MHTSPSEAMLMLDVGRVRRSSFVILALAASPLAAQVPERDAERAPAAELPSPASVLGYEIGERFTDYDGVLRYMTTLAEASAQVELRPYGATVEGRRLVQVAVARADHLERLDTVLARNRELASPETSEARAREIAGANPAVIYFSYGVHGNESSSSEAAMWTAWDLARGAEAAADVLDSVVVVIDPVVNPDGRDRYVDWYKQVRAWPANPNPASREHDEPWPGGRYNHYLFDLNRDWTWTSQPETRARLATWDAWTPQVHVDFHEMSWRSTYFF